MATEKSELNCLLVSYQRILYSDSFRGVVRASPELRFTISRCKKLAALAVRLRVYRGDVPPIFTVDAGYQFGPICVFRKLHNARYRVARLAFNSAATSSVRLPWAISFRAWSICCGVSLLQCPQN